MSFLFFGHKWLQCYQIPTLLEHVKCRCTRKSKLFRKATLETVSYKVTSLCKLVATIQTQDVLKLGEDESNRSDGYANILGQPLITSKCRRNKKCTKSTKPAPQVEGKLGFTSTFWSFPASFTSFQEMTMFVQSSSEPTKGYVPVPQMETHLIIKLRQKRFIILQLFCWAKSKPVCLSRSHRIGNSTFITRAVF